MREMNGKYRCSSPSLTHVLLLSGKYVGSRPIRLTKSTWKDRNFLEVKKKEREKKKLGLR